MPKKQNVKGLAIISELADMLGVDLKDSKLAIATDNTSAKAKFSDGSLEVILQQSIHDSHCLMIESPRNIGIYVEIINQHPDSDAPVEAIYSITTYRINKNRDILDRIYTSGDVSRVYVGPKGFILDESARRKVVELPKK